MKRKTRKKPVEKCGFCSVKFKRGDKKVVHWDPVDGKRLLHETCSEIVSDLWEAGD